MSSEPQPGINEPSLPSPAIEPESSRFKKIFEIVSNKYPTPDFIKRATDAYGHSFEEFDEEDQEYLLYLPTPYSNTLKRLAKEIEATEIKDEEIPEYIDTINSLSTSTIGEKQFNHPIKGPENFLQHTTSEVKASETLIKAKLWLELFNLWNQKYPSTNEENRKIDFDKMVTLLSGRHTYPRPNQLSLDQTRNLAIVYMDTFAIIDSVEFQEDYKNPGVKKELIFGVEDIIGRTHNADYVQDLLDIYQNIKSEDPVLVEAVLQISRRYASNHGLGEATKKGITTKLMPMLKSNNPQVDILQRPTNCWGMDARSFGVADFLVHTITTKVTPKSINENLMILKEVPATNTARFEQNRRDAKALAGTFGILRDFIHDQQPYVHQVLVAMVNYYYSGDRTNLEGFLKKAKYFGEQDRRDILLDRTNYDKLADDTVDIGTQAPAIQILKRLAENTIPLEEKPPQTFDLKLNQLMIQLDKGKLGGVANKEHLETTIDYLNTQLIQMIQTEQIGLEPNMVKAIAWLDQQSFKALENLSFEDQQSLYKTPFMKTLLLFQQLTHSSDFNQHEFDQFMDKINQLPAQLTYQLIQARILSNIRQLATDYKEQGREHIIGALWSGNSAHSLIGLTDPKRASTAYGERYQKEAELKKRTPSYHPGD